MPALLILYGTHDGHTAKIAEAAGQAAVEAGWKVEIRHCKDVPANISLEPFSAAIVASPVMAGHYRPYVRDVVKALSAQLNAIPTALISASWTATRQRWVPAIQTLDEADERFFEETGWHPARVIRIGGAILYKKHNPVMSFIWSLIIRRTGGPADRSRDYDFTDWESLRTQTLEFVSFAGQRLSSTAGTG
jgi:menaquinone-dependent protoporphyrinogen oxidase